MSKTFCPIPWMHSSIMQDGRFRICCQCIYEPHGNMEIDDVPVKIQTHTIDEARNAPALKELRKEMLDGKKPSVCKLCWDEEKAGLKSRRLNILTQYPNEKELALEKTNEDGFIDTSIFPIKYFDLRFGNLCNLKCRYCNPMDSSMWYDEYFKMSKIKYPNSEVKFGFKDGYEITQSGNSYKIDSDDFEWYFDEKFWNEIEKILPHIDRFYFTGGEPLINKAHMKLLELCVKLGVAKNIEIDYNSNGVTIPDKLYNLWPHFKKVFIGFSIDGIGSMANYLRYPSKWESIESNLDKINSSDIPNLKCHISSTISIFNIYNFLDIIEWFNNKKYSKFTPNPIFHMLVSPDYMNIQNLPKTEKENIVSAYNEFFEKYPNLKIHYKAILDYMYDANTNWEKLKNLKIHIAYLDSIRKHSLEKEIPWLYDILYNNLVL